MLRNPRYLHAKRGPIIAARALAFVVAASMAVGLGAHAHARDLGSFFRQGNMSIGIGGGGGSDSFAIGARVGYFAVDRLRIDGFFDYRYQKFSSGVGHFVEPGIGARYYVTIPGVSVSFFPLVDVSMIYLSASGTNAIDGGTTFGSVAPGGGIFVGFARNFGVEFTAAALFYFGQQQALIDTNVVPDEAQFRWSFGFAFYF